MWNLAPDPTHYNGIVRVMELREDLREYVAAINAEASATGMPMLRPMLLQFPADAGCAGPDVEDQVSAAASHGRQLSLSHHCAAAAPPHLSQFMFGPDWLVAPVLEYNATARSVYLPTLPSNLTWVHWWSQTNYGGGGMRVNVTTAIDDFPLFFAQPVPVPPPAVSANITALYSSERLDQVVCLSSQCYDSNAPGQSGDYTTQRIEGIGFTSTGGSVEINGTSYAVVPLTLWFGYGASNGLNDNYVATNASAPSADYTVTFNNGYVLAEAAPGSLPLQVWLRSWNSSKWDYATVASAEGVAWAQSNGYTFQFITGYILAP